MLYYFRLGGLAYEINIALFSKLLQRPMGGVTVFVQVDYSQGDFWKNINCNPPHMFTVLLRSLLSTTLFFVTSSALWRTSSSTVLKVKYQGEESCFILWAALHILCAALHRVHVNTAFHITT